MFGLFKKNPKKALQIKIKAKYEESVRMQRNGKLREYGELMTEIASLEAQLKELEA